MARNNRKMNGPLLSKITLTGYFKLYVDLMCIVTPKRPFFEPRKTLKALPCLSVEGEKDTQTWGELALSTQKGPTYV